VRDYSSQPKASHYRWVVVGMAFLANMIGYGLVHSYSVFFKPLALEFGWSRSVTAGAFSMYGIVHTFLAFLTGRLADRFGPRPVMAMAGTFLALSMILMSFIKSVWQLYLFYGFLFSFGVASIYTPSVATVSRWFVERRGFAVGLTAAGIGAGSLAFSPLSAWLISSLGWRMAYIIIGIIPLATFIPITILMRRSPFESHESGSPEGFRLSEAIKTPTFWQFCLSWMFTAMALWAVLVHIVPLLTDRGISIVQAGILASVIGAGSIGGRIGAGFISDKYGRKRIFIISLSIQLAMIIWLFFSRNLWMLFIFALIFGFGSGGWTGTVGAFPADYFGIRATGAILGLMNTIAGIGVAMGPYLGGFVFDITGSYDYMMLICALSTLIAIILASLLKPARRGGII